MKIKFVGLMLLLSSCGVENSPLCKVTQSDGMTTIDCPDGTSTTVINGA